MNILIIIPYYYPNINPRPYRWTQIAEYWASHGHTVKVLTAKNSNFENNTFLNGVEVRRVGHSALKDFFYNVFKLSNRRGEVQKKEQAEKISKNKISFFPKLLQYFNDYIWKPLYFPDDSCIWYFPAKNAAINWLQSEQFDSVISVSLPFTAHLVGRQVKKKFPTIHWIADSGDPFALQTEVPLNNTFLYKRWNKYAEKKVVEEADALSVTTIATQELYEHNFPGYKDKFFVIPPLLTTPDNTNNDNSFNFKHNHDEIQLAYLGKFYKGIREPDVLIVLLKKIFEQMPEWRSKLKIHIFGDIFPAFQTILMQDSAIILHGLIAREQVNNVMQKVDFLINISNQTDYQLPSKAPDYMFSGKPIINIHYSDADCFKDFFKHYPLIHNLKVNAADISTLILFLKQNKGKQLEQNIINALIKPFQTPAIAKDYLDICRTNNHQ